MTVEDWNLYNMTTEDCPVLGILGPAGSGKDVTADWFCEKNNFVKVAFADPMKRFVSRCFSIDHERLWGPSDKRNESFDIDQAWWFNAISRMGDASEELIRGVLDDGVRVTGMLQLHDWLSWLRKTYPDSISTRVILQTLGTEWGRSVDPTMWVNYAHKTAQYIKLSGCEYTQGSGCIDSSFKKYAGVIIPDHRFRNEVVITQGHGGYVIRLRRLAQEASSSVGITGHQSEAEQKAIPDDLFDLVLEFPEGIDKVHGMLETVYRNKLWTSKMVLSPSS